MTTTWHNLLDLGLNGIGWSDSAHPYDRLPARAEGVVRDVIWQLSRKSTGLYVDFRSNATRLEARTILRHPPMEHLSYVRYLDLYARDERDGRWRWAGVNQNGFIPSGETPLIGNLTPQWRTYRLYLPSAYVVERIELGLPEEAAIEPMPAPDSPPVVVYGTSIVQGSGGATRPGMIWPSILGRRFDSPFINLGFSGSANMEPELGRFIAELNPVGLFIIDPLPNMNVELIEKNGEPFMRTLLQAHPKTPMLLVEDRCHSNEWIIPGQRKFREAKRAAFRAIYDKLKDEGYSQLQYQEGDPLLGEDSEATVDGSHPSDLGTLRIADLLEPVIRNALSMKPECAIKE